MPPAHARAAVHYRVEAADLHAHLFHVTLTVAQPAAMQEVALPAWIPGSYLVREFAKNLQRLNARQGRQPVTLVQLAKDRWRADCQPGQPLVLSYEVCAYDASVRTAWLDAARGFFNATSLCLQVAGQTALPCEIDIVAPKKRAGSALWHCATGLFPLKLDARGFGRYRAADYDELADCPVEMGAFWSASFNACGVPHRFVVAGAAPSFDGARLLADTRKVCEAAIRFWHPRGKPPFKSYLFLLNTVHEGYGGLEHRNSTALICGRRDLPRKTEGPGDAKASDGYTQLLGLISHEYFHTWNVKRLRPREFAQYDYTRENYTELLWFFEGFTSYYDDLLLRRAGLIDDVAYLKLLAKTCTQVLQTPGRQVQSVAQASFDAWIKYYRQDENTPNATVSYYTKGALVALCLDLALRREGGATLDAVMRALWQRCAGGPMAEADLLAVLQALTGRDWQGEIAQWVHGTAELPLAELLAAQGVALKAEPAQPAQRLGLRVQENHSVQIKTVLRGSAAERAGFMADDEWLGLEAAGQAWRLQRLDDLALYAGAARQATALVARDGRLLRLPLDLPAPNATGDTVRLELADAARAQAWLAAG
jgi:predicted metalloprotease with PDZ domain